MPFANCPLCNKRYPESFLATHASSCNPTAKRKRSQFKHSSAHSGLRVYRTRISKSALSSEVGAPGFHLFPAAFSDIETQLLNYVRSTPPEWNDYRFRKVKNYGPPYNLRERRFLFDSSAPPQIPIPAFVHNLVLPRFKLIPVLSSFSPNQLSVAEYPVPGGHILPHNDCENGKIHTAVVGVCLGARCTMTLILRSRYSGLGKDVKRDVSLPPGAVYVMSGDALRVWEHAIFPRNTDDTRYSLTFRDVSPSTGEALWSKVSGTTQNVRTIERDPRVPELSRGPDTDLPTVKESEFVSGEEKCKRGRLVQKRLS